MRYLFFLLFPAVIVAQDSLNISLLGKTELWGPSTTMLVQGHFAYVGLYANEIVVLDVSTPAAPVEIQRLSVTYIPEQFNNADSLLIVRNSDEWSENGSISAYRILANGTLEVLGETELIGHGAPMYTAFSCPYVLTEDWESFKVYNFSNPANPALMEEPDMSGFPVIDGGLLYLWHTNHDTNPWTYSLQIREYEPPSYFPLISELPLGNVGFQGFDVEAGKAVISQHDTIKFIDVSNPNTPHVTAQLYGGSGVRGVDLQYDLVSVVTWAQWLTLFDVQSINTPSVLSQTRVSDWGSGVQLVGDRMYVHAGGLSGFEIFDVSNPSSLTRVGYYFRYGPFGGGGVIEDKLVFAITLIYGSSYSVGVVDISNPNAPHFGLPKVFGEEVAIDNGNIFAIAGNGLVAGELTQAGELNTIGGIVLGEVGLHLSDFSVSDGLAYCLNAGDSVVYVVDVSNPETMTLLDSLKINHQLSRVASDNGIAGILTYNDTLITIDARNHSAIHIGSRTPIAAAHWWGLAKSDGLLAYSAYPNGLGLHDLSSPVHPIAYPVYEPSGQYQRIALSDGRLFRSYRGLKCLDVTVPSMPVVYAYYNDPALRSGYVHIEGNRAICVGGDLSIFDISGTVDASEPPAIPSEVSLAAYPNPFNNATRLSFELPKSGSVKLEAFDVTGRLVETLLDETRGAGLHTLNFDGQKLSSGVYFVRLEAVNRTQTMKVVLIR